MRGRILPGYQNVNRNVRTGSLDRNMIRWQHSKSLSNLSPFFKTLVCFRHTHGKKHFNEPDFYSNPNLSCIPLERVTTGNEEVASGGIFLQITPNIGWCPCLKECLKGLLLTMKGTYFDVGGLLVLPFSRDCRWFSRASKRLLGAWHKRTCRPVVDFHISTSLRLQLFM